MQLVIGEFELDVSRTALFLRLPLIGQGYGAKGYGWTWDWWPEVKREREALAAAEAAPSAHAPSRRTLEAP